MSWFNFVQKPIYLINCKRSNVIHAFIYISIYSRLLSAIYCLWNHVKYHSVSFYQLKHMAGSSISCIFLSICASSKPWVVYGAGGWWVEGREVMGIIVMINEYWWCWSSDSRAGTREMPGRYPCLGGGWGEGPSLYIVFGTLSMIDGRQDGECFYQVLQQTRRWHLSSCFIA